MSIPSLGGPSGPGETISLPGSRRVIKELFDPEDPGKVKGRLEEPLPIGSTRPSTLPGHPTEGALFGSRAVLEVANKIMKKYQKEHPGE
jgi:hypothetical protein